MLDLLQWATARNLRVSLVALPWLLVAVYLFTCAEDRYVSESVVAVRDEGNGIGVPTGIDAISAMFGTTSASSKDQHMLRARILSADMLLELDDKLDLRGKFSSPKLDFVYRLSPNASLDAFLDYFRRRVHVDIDDASGLLTIRTQGFTPELAQTLNMEVITLSERFINESSHRLAREQMTFAEDELHKARQRMDEARNELVDFQKHYGVLNPTAQAEANTGLTAELQGRLAGYEAELKGLQTYLNDDAPQVEALQAQIDGLRSQLSSESLRGISDDNGTSLNVLAGKYQELIAELEFVSDAYRAALTGLETARIESTRKLKSLVLVESPALPEAAEYPRRIYNLFALLMGLTLLYGIARLIVATIEDHQE